MQCLLFCVKKTSKTSKCMDPLTPLTLIYDSLTLPIMCKGMYRKSSRKIARVNTALNDNLISSELVISSIMHVKHKRLAVR